MPGSITVTGGSTSVQSGQRALAPFTILGSDDIGETITTALSQGDNTFAVPLGAVGVVIVPPSNEPVVAWSLRTNLNSSDAGLPIVVNFPFPYIFPTPAPTSIILHASAAQVTPIYLWFW